MSRANQKGRSKAGPPFLQLHHYLLKSTAWRSLSANERVVYLEIAALYNGSNNGALGLGARRAAELCNISKNTSTTCFRALIEHGFIECATPGGFSLKSRHQTEWRLTAHKCDVTGAAPSKAFMKWPQVRPPAVVADLNAARPKENHGPKSGTVRSQNRDSQTPKAA